MIRIIETIGYCFLIVIGLFNHYLGNTLSFIWHGDFTKLKKLDKEIFRVYTVDENKWRCYYKNPYHYLINKKTKVDISWGMVGIALGMFYVTHNFLMNKLKRNENA